MASIAAARRRLCRLAVMMPTAAAPTTTTINHTTPLRISARASSNKDEPAIFAVVFPLAVLTHLSLCSRSRTLSQLAKLASIGHAQSG